MDVYFDHWTSAAQPGPLFFGGGCSLDTGLPADVSRTYHTVQVRKEGRSGRGRGGEGRGRGEGRGVENGAEM